MPVIKPHILIVDDDIRILKLLKKFFEQNNFLVSKAVSAKEAEIFLRYFIFDLLILDIMLPGITGLDFTRNTRSNDNKMPIIMLTALAEPEDRIKGLEAGASDYLTKPFEPRELLLRVKNLIDAYHQYQQQDQNKRFGDNCYNLRLKELTKKDQLVKLSYTEQKLLNIFITNTGVIFSREDLSTQMGGLELRSIDVQVTRIRNKIEDDPRQPQYLKTIRGIGYVFNT